MKNEALKDEVQSPENISNFTSSKIYSATVYIQMEALVHASEAFLQEQLPLHHDLEQQQLVSSTRLAGAGSLVISAGRTWPSLLSHPCSTGEGMFCVAIKALLQTNVW